MKSIKSLTKISNEEIESLKKKYNLQDIRAYKCTLQSDLVVAFVKSSNVEELKNNWQNINNELSEYLEESINQKFIRWDVYIIYLINGSINKELQYKIENNTFFSRKIIEPKYSSDLTEENIKMLISDHINFNDLAIGTKGTNKEKYTSDSKVYSELLDIGELDESKIDEILNVLEKDGNEV